MPPEPDLLFPERPQGLPVPSHIVRDALKKSPDEALQALLTEADEARESVVYIPKGNAEMMQKLGLVHAAELVEGYEPRDNTTEFLGNTMAQMGFSSGAPASRSAAEAMRAVLSGNREKG